ncbi:MAG: DUF4190 domain-containing protein [Gemmatimonadetes bacterium]|nr:DUF4190 domain-containing protein [Gemmatimonadota bacterium]
MPAMNEQNVQVNLGGTGAVVPGNGLAVAGFVCALCSVVLFWVPGLNFILWVLGIVFSGIGLSRANNQGRSGRGLAIAGLVIALLPGTILVFLIFLLLIAL